jgi:cysteinyl-tRNA synthetase
VLRYTLLRGHYRQPLNFTWEIMADSRKALGGLDDLVGRLRGVCDGRGAAADEGAGEELVAAAAGEFEAAMNDDLNTPRALAALFGLGAPVREGRLGARAAGASLGLFAAADAVLGIVDLGDGGPGGDPDDDAAIQALVDARREARAQRDFAEGDRLRDELLGRGILLEDTADGTVWRRR